MATVALTASPTQLDAGTTYDLVVVNSGSSAVHVQVDSGNSFDQRLSPGQSVVVYPHGLAVTAYARSGSGQVNVTTQTNPQTSPVGSLVASLGRSNGTDDSATLQAALTACRTAGRGKVTGLAGESYVFASESIISSNTVLDLSGCSVTVKNGTNAHFLRNYSEKNTVATAADGAATSGSNVITSATLAAQAVVGQTLIVAGAGGNGNGPLVGNISAVNTGTGAITLKTLDGRACNATATVASAAVTLVNRDSNIRVHIGTLANGNNVAVSPGYGVIFFRHLDNCYIDIDEYTSSGVSRGVGIGDVTGWWVRMKHVNTASVAFQMSGPAAFGHLDQVYGYAGDDLVAFTAGDYAPQQSTAGDITNFTVGNVTGVNCGTNIFKLIAGAGWLVDAVRVYGEIGGTGPVGAFVGDDSSQTPTIGGSYGEIDLGTICGQFSLYPVGLVSPAAKRIKVNVRHKPSTNTQPAVSIGGSQTVTIDTLEVTGSAVGVTNKGLIAYNNTAVTITRTILSDGFAGVSQVPAPNLLNVLAARMPLAPFVLGDAWGPTTSRTTAALGNIESAPSTAWTAWSGTFGVVGGYAVPTAATGTKAVTAAVADGYFETVFHNAPTNGEAWMIFRGSDSSNFWRVGYASGTPSQLNLQKVVAGGVTAVGGSGANIQQVPSHADVRVGVLCSGSTIVVFLDGVQVGYYTGQTFNQTANLTGIQASATAAQFGPIYARNLVNGS